jgi:hypothetical protein
MAKLAEPDTVSWFMVSSFQVEILMVGIVLKNGRSRSSACIL